VDLGLALLCVLMGLILSYAVVLGERERRGGLPSWRELAGRIDGLRFVAGDWAVSPALEGSHGGRPVSVRLLRLTTGRGAKIYTRVEVVHGGGGSPFFSAVSREDILAEGPTPREVVATGDAGLDERFEVRGPDPEAVGRWLTDRVKRRLLWEDRIRLEIDGRRITLDVPGIVDDRERVRLLLDFGIEIAAAIG
jgi:hypothetical protein